MGRKRKGKKGKSKKKQKRLTAVDVALKSFLDAQAQVLAAARGDAVTQEASDTNHEWWTWLWTRLQDARFFYVADETYASYMLEADMETTENVVGHEWEPLDFTIDWTRSRDGDRQEYIERIMAASKNVEPPDPARWPFKDVWVAAGSGLLLSASHLQTRIHDVVRNRHDVVAAKLIGQLYTRDMQGRPCILEALSAKSPAYDGKRAFSYSLIWHHAYSLQRGGWDNALDLNPWITHKVMEHLNGFGTYVVEQTVSRQHRQERYKALRGAGVPMPIPKPYYVIKMRSKTVREPEPAPEPSGATWTKTYRTDVRGHERCRVARGPLPLEPEKIASYKKRGYRVYLTGQVKPYDAARLLKRGISPKRPDEWMALRVAWVAEHMSPANEELPYVPAARLA
jgi:hypothetical protein